MSWAFLGENLHPAAPGRSELARLASPLRAATDLPLNSGLPTSERGGSRKQGEDVHSVNLGGPKVSHWCLWALSFWGSVTLITWGESICSSVLEDLGGDEQLRTDRAGFGDAFLVPPMESVPNNHVGNGPKISLNKIRSQNIT